MTTNNESETEGGLFSEQVMTNLRLHEPCGHVRRKVGRGEDSSTAVVAWRCDECGDMLLEAAPIDYARLAESDR